MQCIADVPSLAIEIGVALLPHEASLTSASAAVDVAFIAVLSMVRTLISHARERYPVAGVARAVGVGLAMQSEAAGRTSAAAAVDVGFIAVFSVVVALVRHASERVGVAGVARAVGIDPAMQPGGAGRTSAAAAVDVGFNAVLSLVRACAARALARYKVARVAGAVGIGQAPLTRGAGPTSAASPVDVGFSAVFPLVHAQTGYALQRYKVAGVARASGIAATGPSDRLAHADAGGAKPADAHIAARTAVAGIGVGVGLAAI